MYFYKYVDDELKEIDVNLFVFLEVNYVEIFCSWQCLEIKLCMWFASRISKKC